MEFINDSNIKKNQDEYSMEDKLIKKKYFLNISLLECENIFLPEITNISPFFEISVINSF
jgi:hypothetical protein